MTRRILVGVCSSLLWASIVAAQPVREAVLIQGTSGEPQFAEQHRGWLDQMAATLRDKMKLDPSHLTILAERAGEGEQRATADNVRNTLSRLAGSLQAQDVLFVMLIGHGTADSISAKFNLVGPDLSVEDWNAVLSPIKSRIVFVNTSSASFPFAKGLTGDRRIIITSTRTPAQRYATMFAEAFIQAFNAEDVDLDKNGRVSIWEAFFHASRGVKQYYELRGELASENPVIEDNGDGVARDALSADGEDGTLATMTYLDAVEGAATTDPALQMLFQKQALLTGEVDELRRKKTTMPAAEYDAAWEKLMIALATVGAEIRAKGGGASSMQRWFPPQPGLSFWQAE